MLNKFKTGLTTALAATLCLASVSATAAEWRFKDYDTTGGVLPSVPNYQHKCAKTLKEA